MTKTEFYRFLIAKTWEHIMEYGMNPKTKTLIGNGKITITQKGYSTYFLIDKAPYVKWEMGNGSISPVKMLCISSQGLSYKETSTSEWISKFQYNENMEKSVLSKLLKQSLNDIFKLT